MAPGKVRPGLPARTPGLRFPVLSREPKAHQATLIRRGIEGELVVLFVGAFDGNVVKEQRRGKDSDRNVAEEVGRVEVLAGGFNAGTKGTLVKVVKFGAADQLTLAIGADSIQQAG